MTTVAVAALLAAGTLHGDADKTPALPALAACSTPPTPTGYPENVKTFVDCVAVLGTIPATLAQAPMSSLPYSGVDRTKRISELSDAELSTLCDYDDCIRVDGYLRNCFAFNTNPGTPFRVEAPLVVAGGMVTCYPNPDPGDGRSEASWGTRLDCIEIYRGYFGACHVGPWEDCIREGASRVIGEVDLRQNSSCLITKQECPIQ